MTTGTALMTLAVCVLAFTAAWRMTPLLSLAVFRLCGGHRTASGSIDRYWALTAGVVAPAALIAAFWVILLQDPSGILTPDPIDYALMAAPGGLACGHIQARWRPRTVAWCWERAYPRYLRMMAARREARRRARQRQL